MALKFKLIFIAPKKGEPPFPPFAYIGIKNYQYENDTPIITSQFMSSELDKQINYLKDELDEIRKEADKKFKAKNKELRPGE